MPKTVNFLNNADLLSEIHKSKMSFCYILSPFTKDHKYDIILYDVNEINEESLLTAKKNKALRVQKESYRASLLNKEPNIKQKDFEIDPTTIPDEEIVFRVMTFEHIPDDLIRKKNPKKEADRKAKVNFLPFKHYAYKDGEIIEVARSHWRRGFQRGTFALDHGRLTPKLGYMFMEMVKRYSTRSNWRGYTYVEDMQGAALLQLSAVGLMFDENKSNNPFAYLTAIINNSFTKTLNLEKRKQLTKDEILVNNGLLPSYGYQIAHENKQQKSL